jgi:hypothetical protein
VATKRKPELLPNKLGFLISTFMKPKMALSDFRRSEETIREVMFYTLGQHPHPLTHISEETIQLAQENFDAELNKQVTKKGVWHDMTGYYVCGIKR